MHLFLAKCRWGELNSRPNTFYINPIYSHCVPRPVLLAVRGWVTVLLSWTTRTILCNNTVTLILQGGYCGKPRLVYRSGRNKGVVGTKCLVLGIDVVDCIYILVTCFTSLVQRRAAHSYFLYLSKPVTHGDPLLDKLIEARVNTSVPACPRPESNRITWLRTPSKCPYRGLFSYIFLLKPCLL